MSTVSVCDGGKELETKNILVKEFLRVDGANVYQEDDGWSPTIIVKNPRGQTVYDGPIQFFDDPGNIGNKALGDGVLKVPDFAYTITGKSKAIQLGAQMSFFPDATVLPNVTSNGRINPSATTYGPGGSEVRNPGIELRPCVGRTGLNYRGPQEIHQLATL